MSRRKRSLLFSVVVLLIINSLFAFVGGGKSWARQGEISGRLAVVLVIDVSGSMERTDPGRLRETAASMLIDLLGVDDYLGLITFDHSPELVAPLQPLRDAARKEELVEMLSPRLDPGGATDFLSALELAHRQFQETDFGGRKPVLLLLTDGEPNPDSARREDAAFMSAYMDSLWDAVGALARDRIPVYSVGFSDEVDAEVLRKFSRDTGGGHYIFDEPTGLLVAFFEVLADLKGRLCLLEETVELHNSPRNFSVAVDKYTRQVNLVAVYVKRTGVEELAISLTPPRGTAEYIPGLSVSGRDSYVMAILSLPIQEHYGVWEVTVAGRGEIRAMGNADLSLEAALLEPAPSSHHPLHEPMSFRVELSARDDLAVLPFQVEVHVTGPDDLRPSVIPLARKEGCFQGTYLPVDRPGDYRLQLQVLLEGAPVYTSSSIITVKPLPVLATDFWVGREGFRLGEEMVVTASLQAGGNRLPEGASLQVDSFTLFLDYGDGERAALDLFDDGNPEHGNVRAGDGIWSNRLEFGREGLAKASLTAAGIYRGTDFRLEKSLGEIFTGAAGAIAVAPGPGDLVAAPGRRLVIPLRVENRSSFPETLLAGRAEEAGFFLTVPQAEFTMEPGEIADLSILVELSRELAAGSYLLPLSFSAGHPLTVVEPAELELQLTLLTPWQYRWQGTLHGARSALAALWPFLLAALLFFGGGLLLYRLLAAPREKLGLLAYWKVENAAGKEPGKIRLGRTSGTPVVVSFNPGSAGADFIIEGGGFSHDLIFSVERLTRAPRFLLGWRSLFSGPKESWFRKKVECTPPGIIEVQGAVHTRKELINGDEFVSGRSIFRYYDASARRPKAQGRGGDLLEGKV